MSSIRQGRLTAFGGSAERPTSAGNAYAPSILIVIEHDRRHMHLADITAHPVVRTVHCINARPRRYPVALRAVIRPLRRERCIAAAARVRDRLKPAVGTVTEG